jgi:hypothetical protein
MELGLITTFAADMLMEDGNPKISMHLLMVRAVAFDRAQ